MSHLTAKEILARAVLATEVVKVPGGGTVLVRELSVAQRATFSERAKADPLGLVVWLAAECCVDESGAKLFDDESAKALHEGSPRIVDAIGQAVLKLSGMRDEDKGADSGEVSAPS